MKDLLRNILASASAEVECIVDFIKLINHTTHRYAALYCTTLLYSYFLLQADSIMRLRESDYATSHLSNSVPILNLTVHLSKTLSLMLVERYLYFWRSQKGQ